ncbi:hypothetical protein LX97_03326 [Nonlabens dokdonensis]|uniref:Uncharacterized protein n=1 Tax=Nonlabens dokdonensis TaxID=328515 RepID=A0ABX5PU43_9FLAO|nr:hypothetical protein [Nonlabens dokdonensis]PZX36861.1 hypothetical protein LX97_03326 [Nonlabens dokdonensis]
MKSLYKLNLVLFIIMLVLFVTIYLGLLMMPVVGVVQVMSAFWLYSKYSELPKEIQRKLNIYSILSVCLLTIFIISIQNSFHDFFLVPLTGCGLMSIVFMHILYKNYKYTEEKFN